MTVSPRSYVYMAINITTGQYYIGYRRANKLLAENDIGVKYFTSSSIVKNNKHEYDWIVLEEFSDPNDAYFYEQKCISKVWGNPLLLNRHYQLNGKKAFYVDENGRKKISESRKGKPTVLGMKRGPQTAEHKEKARVGKIGKTYKKRSRPTPKTEETRKKLSEANKGKKPWTTGLTTKNDERIAALGKKISKTLKGHSVSDETREKLSIAALNTHKIKVSCLCCKKVMDLGNFSKHTSGIPNKNVSCLCCKKTWDKGNYSKHVGVNNVSK